MSLSTPPPPPAAVPSSPGLPPAKKRSCLLYGCGGLVVLLLAVIAAILITLWWVQRPIKPVVLSPPEKAAVDEKLRKVGVAPVPERTAPTVTPPAISGGTTNVELPSGVVPENAQTPDRRYVPGSKVLTLTEREVNGLLNANTDLGKSVRLEFDKDAINAYIAVRIPQDFPIGSGKMFRARGRFRVSIGNGGQPYAVLEDVTVWGLSLPKAWLGGLKGENLLGEAMSGRTNSPVMRGIKSLRIEPGSLILEVED